MAILDFFGGCVFRKQCENLTCVNSIKVVILIRFAKFIKVHSRQVVKSLRLEVLLLRIRRNSRATSNTREIPEIAKIIIKFASKRIMGSKD